MPHAQYEPVLCVQYQPWQRYPNYQYCVWSAFKQYNPFVMNISTSAYNNKAKRNNFNLTITNYITSFPYTRINLGQSNPKRRYNLRLVLCTKRRVPNPTKLQFKNLLLSWRTYYSSTSRQIVLNKYLWCTPL